ncbi:RDD family protein [Halonatronum saccharophilum]|uniref:RDD family protein n=1 Tax=Halonatronum saccharophilum TaxID=150060 RepID=UPI003CCBDD24
MKYAHFWRRIIAAFIDLSIMIGFTYGIGLITFNSFVIEVFVNNIVYIINLLYFIILPASSKRGTLGKVIMGIQITNISGENFLCEISC